jgi:hypothetical protein
VIDRIKHRLPFSARDYRRLAAVSLTGKGFAIGASGWLVARGGEFAILILPSALYWVVMACLITWTWNHRTRRRDEKPPRQGV